MHLRHFERLVADVDTRDSGARDRHGLGKEASAAPHIQDTFAFQSCYAVDVAQPQGIDVMQRLEFAVRIPPAVGQFAELLQLDRIDVDHLL